MTSCDMVLFPCNVTSQDDKKFLQFLESALLMLMEKYEVTSTEELIARVMEEAKKATADETISTQMEFLSLVKHVMDAYRFAEAKHASQKRASGEPYIRHPLFVALNEIYHQKHETGHYHESPIIAALLHDTVEDTDTSFSDITDAFGTKVEHIVEKLTNHPDWSAWKKEGKLTHREKSALQFINALGDEDALRVKYDDRMHNLDTIRHMPPQKQVNKILDTLEVGFIEHAEYMSKYYFLLQLYLTITRYLTDTNLEEYTDDPELWKEKRDSSLHMIKDILKRHQGYFSPDHNDAQA